jgi:Uma2 family endonuclease
MTQNDLMPPTKPGPRPATLADLEALPADVRGEIIDGVLYTMTRPGMRHQYTAGEVFVDLRIPFGRGRGAPGGWWIVLEPGIELSNTSPEVSPDLAGWRRDRLPALPRDDESIRIVPDWVCEVLSKNTRRHDLGTKMPSYARAGISYAWIVDVGARLVTAHRLEAGRWVTIGTYTDETEARIEPFDVVPLDVTGWWPPPGSVEDSGGDEP